MILFEDYSERMQHSLRNAFAKLEPVSPDKIDRILAANSGIPSGYIQFLSEYGVGVLNLGDFPDFDILDAPIDAAKDYFKEEVYFSLSDFPAPKGRVLGFSTYSDGTLYGFDSGDDWRLVAIDGRRDVVRLELDFIAFVAGLVACFPQHPFKRSNKGWLDEFGDFYPEL